MSSVQRAVSIRGLAEWLLRDYLTDLGARPDPEAPAVPRMIAEGWRVSWTSNLVRIAGSSLVLTQFDLVFSGSADTVTQVEEAFTRKAQRGGG